MVTKQALRARERRAIGVANGLCLRCGEGARAHNRKMCYGCLAKRRVEGSKAWKKRREKNPDNCSCCFIYPRLGGSHLCDRCFRLKAVERHRLKADVVHAYGGSCSCCGESEMYFLTIDHISGIAGEDRVELKVRATTLYRRLRRANYPDGFRVLCMNCNWAIGVLGSCPHQGAFPTRDGFSLTPRQQRAIASPTRPKQHGMTIVDDLNELSGGRHSSTGVP